MVYLYYRSFTMEYTSEQLNYFRICYIAFNLVPEGLRQVFKQEWNFLYKTTLGEWKDTPKNGLDFYNKESRKSRSKNARYLATIQNGITAEWDCSCLFFAILFSDSIGTTLSAAIRKEVDDLRQVRNDIAHITEAKLTDAEFRGYVGRVLLAFNSLSLPISDIDAVRKQTNFPTAEVGNLNVQVANLQSELKEVKTDLLVAQDTIQRKEEQVECLTQEINSKVQSFCNLTFKPSHQIIRRSNDVTRIMTKMQELDNESNGAVSTIYLSGNPGCGKTQIARQIGEQFFKIGSGESEGLTFVATLNAETLEALADSCISLAKQLGITEYSLTNLATTEVNSPNERIQHLQCLIFPKFKHFSKWLIIADNVVNLSSVCKYLPQTASEEWGHGQVLITTQDTSAIPSNAPHTYHESLSAGMHPKEAAELLKQVSQNSDDDKVETVAEILEYQPLALAAAAFYVQTVMSNGSPNYNWAKYKETLDFGQREATEEPLAQGSPAYSKTMTTAIEMAINRILESDEILRQVFFFFSLCDSEPLPIEAAVNFVKARTSRQTEELIRAKILNSSLITCLYTEDGAPGYARVHKVVYEVLRKMPMLDADFTDKVECMSVAIHLFHSVTESECNHLNESGHVCVMLRRITAHCKILHAILTDMFAGKDVLMRKELTPFLPPESFVSWLCSIASLCCDLSIPSRAMLFSESACDFIHYISRTRKGDLVKAGVFAVHGRALSMSCQYQASLLAHTEAIYIYRAVYGEEHATVAASYNRKGRIYTRLGDYSLAKRFHEEALNIQRKIYDDDNAEIAESYCNLGLVYQCLGKQREAKTYQEKALVVRKNIYGEEHAAVATGYSNLGLVYQNLEQHSEAKECHEKALKIREKIYGEEHADVGASYNNMGNVYRDLGRYSEAKEYHKKALIMRKKISGEEHDTVAVSYGNLGIVCLDLGQFIEAKEYLEKALIIQKKIYGEEHTDVATSYNNLAFVCKVLEENNEAKEHYKKAVSIKEKIFNEEHDEVADIYGYLASVCTKLGQYSEAEEFQEKQAQIIRKRIWDRENDLDFTMFSNIGLRLSYKHNIERYSDFNFEITSSMAVPDIDSNVSQCDQSRRACCILI